MSVLSPRWPRSWSPAVPTPQECGPRAGSPSATGGSRSSTSPRPARQPMVDPELGSGGRLERLHLQLRAASRRAGRPRLPVLLPQRHRGAAQGLPPLGRPVRRPPPGHVRLRHRRARQRPGAAGPRPPRHQAALRHRERRPDPVRVLAAGAARRWRCRHPHRSGRAAPLPDVPLRRAVAAHDPARSRASYRPPRCWRSNRTAAGPPRRTGSRTSPAAPTAPTGPRRTGRTPFSPRCAPRSSGGWSPTCRSAACCPAASTPA